MASFRASLGTHDVHPRQFAILWALADGNGRSQQEVSAELRIPASRLVALVDDLEERGLVSRSAHPSDRRAHVLRLTPAGKRTFQQLLRVARAHEERMFAGLSESEQEQLRGLLLRICANLQTESAGPVGIRAW